MKTKVWNRMLGAGIALTMTVALVAGCGQEEKQNFTLQKMEAEESHAFGFDIAGGDDVMPIAAYYGPYSSIYSINGQSLPDYLTDEYWQAMADCGVTLMSHSITDYATAPYEVEKNLDFGEKYKIAVVVDDSNVRNMADLKEISVDKLTKQLSNYMNHPAFGGLYVVDEPMTSYFEPANDLNRELNRYKTLSPLLIEDVGIFCYENALSSGTNSNAFENYERYLREYCDVLHPTYLQFDRYPFDEAQEGLINRYFYDLSKVRKVAQEYKIPFWTFIQAGSQWNDAQNYFTSTEYWPNESEFMWNINTCLAFGSQGISYFPFIQPYYFAYAENGEWDFERNGMIGAWGNKNRWYYYAVNMAKQIQAIDEVLMNSVNKGVLVSGEDANKDMQLATEALISGTAWRELKSVDGDAMIGCFNYQGKTALYVVNYSQEYKQNINLTFQDTYTFTKVQNAEYENLTGNGITLEMDAGEGVLLVFGGETK